MHFDDVPGWITVTDQQAFKWVLEYQNRAQPPGELLEIGAYKGKSAIVIGRFLKYGERFTVCDLFEDVATSTEINKKAGEFYQGLALTQKEFESNYLNFHSQLPHVVRGPSVEILKHVNAGSCRFIHIDGSHMYEHVRQDTESARQLLQENGVVVFDDYRTEHTPGVAAAVWESVLNGDLRPIFHTIGKFYATWGNPTPLQDEIIRRASLETSYTTSQRIYIRDMPIVRMYWLRQGERLEA